MRKTIFPIIMLCLLWQVSRSQDLHQLLSDTIDVVVAADGSGDYTTIMGAVNASNGNQVIFIKNGVYTEKVEIGSNKDHLTIIGESVDSTIIQFGDYAGSGESYSGIISSLVGTKIGTSTSHSFYNQSYDLTLMNLTIKNIAGDVGQAVALNLNQDRTRVVHCRIMGNQDTFLTWKAARHFIKDCFIEGDVDFIFGGGAMVLDSCVINSNRSDSHITAPATGQNWKFGYVFKNCVVTANRNVSNVYFSRPWHNYPKVIFMNCYLGDHIAPAGWDTWGVPVENCLYAEYDNYGPGAGTDNRVTWAIAQLNESTATLWTDEYIFNKDVSDEVSSDWDPDIYNNKLYKILRANTSLLYDENFNSACLDTIKYDGNIIEGVSQDKAVYTVELPAATTTVPVVSVVPDFRKATVEIIQAENLPGTATIKVTSGNGVKMNYTVGFTLAEDGTSVNGLEPDNKIKLLKNPANSTIEFALESIYSNVGFALYNISGQLVYSEKFESIQSKEVKAFEIGSLKKGVYFYRFSFGTEIIGGKVIKL